MVKESKFKAEEGSAEELLPFDFRKLLKQFKIPGVDYSAIVEREKKNIEALTEANKIAFEGWRDLVRRQAQIMQETMSDTVANARKQDTSKVRANLAIEGFEKALNHMRELAEIAAKSQREAFEVVQKRIKENMEDLQRFGKGD